VSNQDAPTDPKLELPSANLTALGNAIRDARRRRKLTSEGLAQRAGMSRRMLTEIEAGRSAASIVKLHAISHALSVDLAGLVSSLCEGHDPGSRGVPRS
jgi:transcriptional regulator with XRE-family HTH domain